MKSINKIYILMVFVIFTLSCEKESPVIEDKEPIIEPKLASISINPTNQITSKGAIFSAKIAEDGGSNITSRGFVYNTSGNPTLDNYEVKTSNGKGIGEYQEITTNLKAKTKYFLKAYATNNAGTAYSNLVEFTTLAQLFSGGIGTLNDPYLIGTPQQLDSIRFNLDKHFIQIANINLSNFSREDWIPMGFWIPIGKENSAFSGSFDGNSFKIRNLKIDLDDASGVGLFGTVHNSKIINVHLENVNIIGKSGGSLVAHNSGGIIKNCFADGKVIGNNNIGGLIGINTGTVIKCTSNISVTVNENSGGGLIGRSAVGSVDSCSSSGEVIGFLNMGSAAGLLGGLIGVNMAYLSNCNSNCIVKGGTGIGGLVGSNSSEIINCYSKGNITGISLSSTQVGGLVGWNRGEIQLCYSSGNVSGKNVVGGLLGQNLGEIFSNKAIGDVSGIDHIGGLVGINSNIIRVCLSKNKIIGEENVGGIVGKNESGKIDNCYSTNEISGDKYIGGIVGYNVPGSVTNSYSVGKISGNKYTGGIIGGPKNIGGINYCYYDTGTTGQSDTGQGTPKSTQEMMQKYTFFSHWNFTNIWNIDEGKSYPFLKWEKP